MRCPVNAYSIFIYLDSEHDDMNMGVIIQASVMSMQNCGHTNSGPKVFRILAEVFQSAGDASKQKVVHETFFIPHWVTTALIAAWAPPRSMCVVARRIRSGEPTALGNNQQGLRCLHHKARNA